MSTLLKQGCICTPQNGYYIRFKNYPLGCKLHAQYLHLEGVYISV